MSTRSRHAVTDTLPALFPAVFPGHADYAPLDLLGDRWQVEEQIKNRLLSSDFDAWTEALARVGNHATLLFAAATHPKIVSERLGHATISITLDIYSHVLPSMQQDAVSQLDALFSQAKARRV